MKFFTTPNSKNIIETQRLVTTEKFELAFIFILMLPRCEQKSNQFDFIHIISSFLQYSVMSFNYFFINSCIAIELKNTVCIYCFIFPQVNFQVFRNWNFYMARRLFLTYHEKQCYGNETYESKNKCTTTEMRLIVGSLNFQKKRKISSLSQQRTKEVLTSLEISRLFIQSSHFITITGTFFLYGYLIQ